jgi:outer membrane protein OmpA-like peptidoglycan-associated protein
MNRLAAQHGTKLVLAGLATLWLTACSVPDSANPIDWYRDAMGLSADDPPEDTRNTGNLAAGNSRDYPNLATVPPTPTRALTTAEREALTQRLVSDRANAKYIDEQLRGGSSAAGVAPPPPASVATASAAPATPSPAPPSPPAPAPAATPTPAPEAAAPATAAVPPPSLAPPASPPTAAPTSRIVSLSAPPPNPELPAEPTPAPAAPPPAAAAPAATAPAATGRSAPWVSLTAPPPAPDEQEAAAPPAPAPSTPAPPAVDANGQPRESPLTNPIVRSLPEPETPRPAPAPPTLAQGGKSQSAAAGTQISSRRPASAPPRVSPVGVPIAQVTFADNSARLSPADRRTVGEVIPLQRQTGGAFRVVGYASKGGGSASQQLANFRIALDRANAVASVLAQAGIAPDQILVETAPPSGESGVAANRAEIFLEN